MKRTNFSIGATGPENQKVIISEAKTAYVQQDNDLGKQREQLQTNKNLVTKLKSANFTIREQKQGGMVNNYF